jgi:hypothetical protein
MAIIPFFIFHHFLHPNLSEEYKSNWHLLEGEKNTLNFSRVSNPVKQFLEFPQVPIFGLRIPMEHTLLWPSSDPKKCNFLAK